MSPDFVWSEVADADGAVGINAEDFVKGEDRCGCGGDDGAADDGHLALVNVTAPDGEAAVDDGGDAENETEHHDHGETVTDAGLEVGGIERGALSKGADRVEGEERGQQQCQAQTGIDGEGDGKTATGDLERVFHFFHGAYFSCFVFLGSFASEVCV